MEHVVAMAEYEWNSFSGMYSSSSSAKEADFMAQVLGNCSLPNELNNDASNTSWPLPLSNVNMMAAMDEASGYVNSDDNAADMNYFSSNTHQGSYCPNESHEQVFVTNNPSMSIDFFTVDAERNNVNLLEGDDFLNQDASNDSMVSYENVPESAGVHEHMHEVDVPESSNIMKKRSRLPVDQVQKNKRFLKPKKNQRIGSSAARNDDDHEEKNIANLQRQNSIISCCSEDGDSNAYQELNGKATSSSSSQGPGNGKRRANRGSATDPQSLYARKRRERINERLRILQSLVPNGTKVDISTMLEEAVQYVKFLQLQIKLLSSDDLWMYAPIAYNGMDIGLDLKIATTRS